MKLKTACKMCGSAILYYGSKYHDVKLTGKEEYDNGVTIFSIIREGKDEWAAAEKLTQIFISK